MERTGRAAARPPGESMHARAARRHELVLEQLAKRQSADTQRAHDIFAAFRANLRDSLALLRSKDAEAEAMLWADDQQLQWRRDIEAMQRRLEDLDDEEAREIAAITERYAEVKPHTTAAAVVFALTPEDAEGRTAADGPPTASPARCASASDLHRQWLELVDTDGPFLAIPPLKRVWPQGMPALPDERKDA